MSNSFSLVTGKVTRIRLTDPDGNAIDLSKVMDWNYKPDVKEIESQGLDGTREILLAYNGASGGFTAELKNSGLYDFFNARQQEYKTSGQYRYSSFAGYIDYPDGTEQILRFKNVSLTLEDSSFSNENTVKFKISFKAQDVSGM